MTVFCRIEDYRDAYYKMKQDWASNNKPYNQTRWIEYLDNQGLQVVMEQYIIFKTVKHQDMWRLKWG